MKRPELLAIYLDDHLAGSIGGVETARRARGSDQGTEFAFRPRPDHGASPELWRLRCEEGPPLVARSR